LANAADQNKRWIRLLKMFIQVYRNIFVKRTCKIKLRIKLTKIVRKTCCKASGLRMSSRYLFGASTYNLCISKPTSKEGGKWFEIRSGCETCNILGN